MSTPLSEKKLAANRANAQKSTGPRTPAGKLISARNALTHALSARLDPAYLPEEDRLMYQAFLDAFLLEHDPQTPLATFLVHRLALLAARLARCAMAEAEIPRTVAAHSHQLELRNYHEELESQQEVHADLLRTKGQAYADQHAPPPVKPTLDEGEHADVLLARLFSTRHDTKNPYARLQRHESTTHRQFQQTLTRLTVLTPNNPQDHQDPTPTPSPQPAPVTNPDPDPTHLTHQPNQQNEPTEPPPPSPTQDSALNTPSLPLRALRVLCGEE